MSNPNETIDPKDIEYVPTNIKWIRTDSPSAIGIDELDTIAPFIEKSKVPPSNTLQKALSLGIQYINNTRETLGLTPINQDSFQYAILSPTDYNEVVRRFTNGTESADDALGSHIDDLETVIIKEINLPTYILASIAVHEWVHAFIDRKIHAIGTDRDGIQYEEYRRSGLSVKRIPSGGFLGKYINEMGNHLLQSEFQSQLLKNPLFEKENKWRESSLSRLGFRVDNPDLYDFVANIDNGKQIIPGVLSRKNIHFDQDGQWSRDIFYLLMQLGDDLSQLIDREAQGSFRQLLIESKVYPEKQIELRRLVDSTMGKGFYLRLKRANLEIVDTLQLLKEVQDKLYRKLDSK